MSELERDLRAVLRRKEPPPGFTERLMRRIGPRRAPRWVSGAIAAGLALTAAGGAFEYRQYRIHKAGRELVAALEIAGGKLNLLQQKVFEWNRRSKHE